MNESPVVPLIAAAAFGGLFIAWIRGLWLPASDAFERLLRLRPGAQSILNQDPSPSLNVAIKKWYPACAIAFLGLMSLGVGIARIFS